MRQKPRPPSASSAPWLVEECAAVERLVTRLGGRRSLSATYEHEGEHYLNASILEQREWLTETLTTLSPERAPYRLVEQMRTACNRYLDAVPDPKEGELRPGTRDALQRLRESFRVKLRVFEEQCRLPLAGELALSIPDGPAPHGPLGPVSRPIYVRPPREA